MIKDEMIDELYEEYISKVGKDNPSNYKWVMNCELRDNLRIEALKWSPWGNFRIEEDRIETLFSVKITIDDSIISKPFIVKSANKMQTGQNKDN